MFLHYTSPPLSPFPHRMRTSNARSPFTPSQLSYPRCGHCFGNAEHGNVNKGEEELMCFRVFPTAAFRGTVYIGLLDFTSFRPYFS
jgi:hypothetical protein